ncbi:adenosine deaminase family protein [Paracoccus contaminans]|uniref:adenosine deaminase family protein n=1 Tax=Paracoccus contaminans TaxID=1945662 RepID=UPI001F0A62EC|nr:adenosine deaminase [Paracoccus contaminans]
MSLEGAAPPAFLRDLAARRRADGAAIFDKTGHYRRPGAGGLPALHDAVAAIMGGPEDHARLLRIVLETCAEQGVLYAELSVSPELCGAGDLAAWREHVAAWTETAAAMRAQGIDSRGIVTALAHHGQARARAAARCAAETAGAGGAGWIAGFGLAGVGGGAGRGITSGARDFAWAFDCACEAGLGLTCRAAEESGAQAVRDALALGIRRIGPGLRATEDGALVRALAEAGVTLELCPGADIAQGLCPGWAAHPIARLADGGCRVTVSAEAPAFLGTAPDGEYDRLADAFGWGEAEFARMSHWALDGAFCDRASAARLRAGLPPLSGRAD